ncbi:MAG: phenylalanine--tRNA ligase subunit beta [Candidatus Levybacteria bacterium RIFCSPHIGHO2_01_FULL_40_10]|nr:MAG: phenylalanine--tRNA ligase subunit beta [Candidatus Levybacteria bacterium RIFCSPHIGHO2_01_FULL_40_10]
MNIKILDSWLREFIKTAADAKTIADRLSLTSVSVEKLEKHDGDYIYDIEVTTNRPDLMSITGLAREAAGALSQAGIKAEYIEPEYKKVTSNKKLDLEIVNNPKLVNRICAVALDINLKPSPEKISKRLEAGDIRSINNAVDVTNYVMREVGHPMHVFDYDKLLKTGKMIIRESKPGEKIVTLDEKEYMLKGGDIVADNGKGEIIDLLGVMGTLNSAVSDDTKRVLLFVDNNDPHRIRKTSMGLAIRSEAATLNEKGVDVEKAMDAILRGVELLEKIADAKLISGVFDIYPNKPKIQALQILETKINSVIGITIPLKTSWKILNDLGFTPKEIKDGLEVRVPSWRANDVSAEEDIIEEIVRVYGYANLPNTLPAFESGKPYNLVSDRFYWEERVKTAFKYWGFTEVYTYSMVGENMLEQATKDAVVIKNPLTEDRVYMRTTIVPSLLEAVRENKGREKLRIFELANVYLKKAGSLPDEKLKLAALIKGPKLSFLEAKGIVEALLEDLGISGVVFKAAKSGAAGASVFIGHELLGEIERLEEDLIDLEFDFETLLKHVSLKKVYKPTPRFPEAIEDLRFEIGEQIPYEKIVRTIHEQSNLIKKVELLDVYKTKKTFRIIYQSGERNLTSEDITQVREKIISALKKHFRADPA